MPWDSSKSRSDVPEGLREEEESPLRVPGCAATWLAVPGPPSRPQLPPDDRGVPVPAGLGGPALQRELPAGQVRAGLPGVLPVSARRSVPG